MSAVYRLQVLDTDEVGPFPTKHHDYRLYFFEKFNFVSRNFQSFAYRNGCSCLCYPDTWQWRWKMISLANQKTRCSIKYTFKNTKMSGTCVSANRIEFLLLIVFIVRPHAAHRTLRINFERYMRPSHVLFISVQYLCTVWRDLVDIYIIFVAYEADRMWSRH